MLFGWEGNRRSGIALAMRPRLKWLIHVRAHGLDREMSTRLRSLVQYGPFTFTLPLLSVSEKCACVRCSRLRGIRPIM